LRHSTRRFSLIPGGGGGVVYPPLGTPATTISFPKNKKQTTQKSLVSYTSNSIRLKRLM
jgi:hypothetical protein